MKGQEIIVGQNIQKSLAQKLQDISSQFRMMQSNYLREISKKSNQSKDVFAIDLDKQKQDAQKYDLTLTDEQLYDMELLTTNVSQRENEINNVSKSIIELSTIFKDLQSMVIHQGTMLDRIDYNVENTLVNVEAAKDELIKAEEYQKNSPERKIILILFIIFVVLFLLFLVKVIY
ncbi:hypothetical protein BB559_003158 [Furculomyces boomerangus]|uniref:t-SNARE coiled-coil homology domain-containing protein n=2 Tax=Harpellales TaxID=61421 RepID=A0A2T9YN38_9FUNG|nr:hypothetical protein BB559_003158 [Furculomyces boomerangus]PVZ99852.1 hypothetical protein BB558_004100 [Smittium angustum]